MTQPAPAPQTVLLLHAYPLSAAMWDAQKAALEEAGFAVLAPDLPGFGGQAGAITSLEDAARDLLGALVLEPVALVGLSMGGYLAMELLAQAPERFTRVVLADTSLRADDPEKTKDRLEQADRVEQEGAAFIVEAAEKEHSPATFRRVRPMIETASREGIAGALRAMAQRPEQRDTLRDLAVPLLVLVGEHDEITPPELAQEIADAGRGTLRLIPGAAHLSNLDAPEAFSEALLAFLR
ncbi:alpha/beta fold hydrolase [Deinococcus budaensis]|uniref:Pimeloyl-ACP methyl ester carboxylesterase n=1 Tax=Deinococcus budaensis TaxID=1665626 RepID=A0A7W8LPG7_9DEIO|nr:alpha/beta hydrolase [Deinococcus budaensis]MBB5233674.1 pimeloyl-ACP methyl ester carboxylesterase [Deinococcus budaensis]